MAGRSEERHTICQPGASTTDAGFTVTASGNRVSHRAWLTVIATAGTADG